MLTLVYNQVLVLCRQRPAAMYSPTNPAPLKLSSRHYERRGTDGAGRCFYATISVGLREKVCSTAFNSSTNSWRRSSYCRRMKSSSACSSIMRLARSICSSRSLAWRAGGMLRKFKNCVPKVQFRDRHPRYDQYQISILEKATIHMK